MLFNTVSLLQRWIENNLKGESEIRNYGEAVEQRVKFGSVNIIMNTEIFRSKIIDDSKTIKVFHQINYSVSGFHICEVPSR